MAVDASGNLYIADTANNRVREVNASTQTITTVAGIGIAGFSNDGSTATAAELSDPQGVAVDPFGNLYIADTGNNRVREVSISTGEITTQAGDGYAGYSGDGSLSAVTELFAPTSIAFDAAGDFIIADSANGRIREGQNNTSGESQLTSRGVTWMYQDNIFGATPSNQSSVLGAVIGANAPNLPNGSTYVAGSYTDDLTSDGAVWEDRDQTKAPMFILSGAAATTAAVVEPYADANRFTDSSIFAFLADGSTIGEALAKSIAIPDVQLSFGDLLDQPGADVPQVSIIAGPADGATVSGTISLSASAALVDPRIATGIRQLELLVDGRIVATASGGSATFTLNTATLSDGQHELRVVAVNNAAAASEGYTATTVDVDNLGRSVSISGGNLTITGSTVTPITVSSTPGSAAVTQIELQCLGRVVGQINAAAGTIDLDPTLLAYDANTITPVAVFSDGMQVAGAAITVTRNPAYLPGHAPSPVSARVSGIAGRYFEGQGGATIASSTYSGVPNATATYSAVNIWSGQSTNLDASPTAMPTADIDDLAVRLSSSFDVPTAGEYYFFFWDTNDSAQLQIDGTPVLEFDGAQSGQTTMNGADVFLGAGEHDLTVLTSKTGTSSYYDISLQFRGPDGITQIVSGSSGFYEVLPTVTAANITLGGTPTGAGGVYRAGDTVTVAWNNTAAGDDNSDPLTAVTMDFSQFGGPSAVAATDNGGVWTASYAIAAGTIAAGTIAAAGCNVPVTVSDNSGTTTMAAAAGVIVDNVIPSITIGALSLAATTGGRVTYTVTYADPHFNASTLTAGDITLDSTGTAAGTLSLSGGGASYTVTVSDITGSGTLGISIAAGTASDTVGNLAPVSGPSAAFNVVPYMTVEDFESVRTYNVVGQTATASTSTQAAHDGAYGLYNTSGNDWLYRDDSAVQVQQGDSISVWMEFPTLAAGQAFFAFGSTSAGTLSLVASPSTNQLLLQNNNGWGFVNLSAATQSWVAGQWYRLEVDWWTDGAIVGSVFDSSGTTLLESVTASTTVITGGGIGFRAAGASVYWDTVQVAPGVDQTTAAEPAATPAVASSAAPADTTDSPATVLTQTMSFSPLGDHHYGDAVPLAATASSGLLVTFQVVSGPATVLGNSLQVTGVGTITVEAVQTGDTDHLAVEFYQSINVLAAPLTITADDRTTVYGSPLPVLTASYVGLVNGDTSASLTTQPTLSTMATATSNVGPYVITAAGAMDPDYTIGYLTGTLTVTPATPTVSVTDATGTYDGSPFAATALAAGVISGLDATPAPTLENMGPTLDYRRLNADGSTAADLGDAAPTAPGSYAVVATFAGSADYTAASSSATFTIWPAGATATAGLYDAGTSTFYLQYSDGPGLPDAVVPFQPTSDPCIAVAGDWTDSGTTRVGLYDPKTGTFYLANSNAPGTTYLDGGLPTNERRLHSRGRRLDRQRCDHRRPVRP